LEHGNGNFIVSLFSLEYEQISFVFYIHNSHMYVRFHSECVLFFWTGIDLNLSLDEFGVVDFDYV
jgi:hypothetical protein